MTGPASSWTLRRIPRSIRTSRAAVSELLQGFVGCDKLDRKVASQRPAFATAYGRPSRWGKTSEINRQPNHVRGCDNARHLRPAAAVTIKLQGCAVDLVPVDVD